MSIHEVLHRAFRDRKLEIAYDAEGLIPYAAADNKSRWCQAPGNLAANTLRQALRSQPLAISGFMPIVCTLCALRRTPESGW